MRVLGVDPGLTRLGIGVVDGGAGRRVTMVHVEVVRTPPHADIASRLHDLELAIERALDLVMPDVVAVERVFSQHNVRTVMGTAQAGAVAIAAAARRGLPVALHTPSEVKASVTGNGRAEKTQVAIMVTRLLQLPERPTPADAADALALAICHLWRADMTRRVESAVAAAPVGRVPCTPAQARSVLQGRSAAAAPPLRPIPGGGR